HHGPVWARHRDAANATMIDSDDVLLLKPAPSSEPDWNPGRAPGLVEIAVFEHGHDGPPAAAHDAGASPIALLVTEPTPNGFPALPVREGESVVVTVLGFEDEAHHQLYRDAIGAQDREVQLLRLTPTAGS